MRHAGRAAAPGRARATPPCWPRRSGSARRFDQRSRAGAGWCSRTAGLHDATVPGGGRRRHERGLGSGGRPLAAAEEALVALARAASIALPGAGRKHDGPERIGRQARADGHGLEAVHQHLDEREMSVERQEHQRGENDVELAQRRRAAAAQRIHVERERQAHAVGRAAGRPDPARRRPPAARSPARCR